MVTRCLCCRGTEFRVFRHFCQYSKSWRAWSNFSARLIADRSAGSFDDRVFASVMRLAPAGLSDPWLPKCPRPQRPAPQTSRGAWRPRAVRGVDWWSSGRLSKRANKRRRAWRPSCPAFWSSHCGHEIPPVIYTSVPPLREEEARISTTFRKGTQMASN
jgi:hypothetical protein